MVIETYQNKKALLLGNGINQLDSNQSFSWKELLDELKRDYRINVDLDNVFKPFPLAFDEMLHQKLGNNDFNDKIKTLKQKIRTSIEIQLRNKQGYNKYHEQIVKLNYDDILTTNYDYSLEKSIDSDFLNKKNHLSINKKEIKYSLKRAYKFANKKVWHIHGELFDSRKYSRNSKHYNEESIMIGYKHYTDYLEKIQEKVRGKSGSQSVDNQSLFVRLRNKSETPFWIDKFFTHNIDIIGLGLDFSENHLWWLINFRATLKRSIKKSKYQVLVNNNIRFFYPKINGSDKINLQELNNIDDIIKKKNTFMKSKAISELLNAFYVEPKEIECNSYEDFYDKLISKELNNY